MGASRIVNQKSVAQSLKMSVTTFIKRRPDLELVGFPLYDDLLKGYDMKAIEHWLDRRSNIVPINSNEADIALESWQRTNAG